MRDDNDERPLDVALEYDAVEAADYLISRGSGAGKDNVRLLCRACEEGELDVVKKLVEEYDMNPNGKLLPKLILYLLTGNLFQQVLLELNGASAASLHTK